MKPIISFFKISLLFFISLPVFPVSGTAADPEIVTGDIIFHESWSVQGKSIKYLAGGKYSHVGIVVIYQGKTYVLEAAARVKFSKLQTFVKRGSGRHFVVKRLRNYKKFLNERSLGKLKKIARGFVGKRYDYSFEWDDGLLYSAELVWKIYYRGLGVKLSGFRKLGSFDLSHPFIMRHMYVRFGDNIPLDEPVVTPDMLFSSGKLVTVYEN